MFRNWLKKVFQTKSTSRPRTRLSVEALEDRTTPTILFAPTQGPEHVTSGGGPVLGSSSNVPIYLVFWGQYWYTREGMAYQSQILNAVNPVLSSSPYLDGLHQYGVQHRASLDLTYGDNHWGDDPSDPKDGSFSTTDAKNSVTRTINNGMPFDSNGIYLVITKPGVKCAPNPDGTQDGGYHAYRTVTDKSSGHLVPLYFGWIGTDGTLDYVTSLLSHEVAETMTDPHDGGWKDYTVPGPDNEIADREAQSYHYRVNGYLVQAYWSQSDGAFKVDDGNSQNFYVNNNQLVINGDQFGYGYGDTISIDVNAAGGVSVTLNGEVASFEPDASLAPDAISSIVVNTGAGSNSVRVHNEAQAVSLTINDGGNDEVLIGDNGSVQGIRGAVQIYNPSYRTDLVIDDSADTSARTAEIGGQDVYGLAPADIYFHTNSLSSLTIFGGSGGNTFDISDTPSTYYGSFPGYTLIATGAGDLVYVDGTTGNLYLDGGSGHDYVYVGTDPNTTYPMPGNGTLANIKGFVNVFNPLGVTTLVVDDGGDTAGHTATLNGTSLTGLSAGGTIYWTPTSSSVSGGVDELHIYGSAASSAYHVTDTPNLAFGIDLRTGIGNDAVFITGTTGGIGMYNYGGYDSVYVGNGTLAGINGSVNVYGAGSTYLIVQDYLDTTAHSATLTGNYLMGLSTGMIWWVPSSTATGGVTYLKILDGAGSSTYTVTDTPNLLYPAELNTGSGDDTVYITGTTGSLTVNNPVGSDSVYVGSNGTLANVNGAVNVSGNGSTYLQIEDYLDTTAHTATLTGTSLTGLSNGAIQWVPTVAVTGGVTFLNIWGSAAGSIYNITETPCVYYTALSTGAGDDVVNITGTTSDLYLYNSGGLDRVYVGDGTLAGINGFLDVYGAGSTYLVVQDGNDTTARSATLNSYSLTGLSTGTIQWTPSVDATGGVTYLRIDGSSATSTYSVTDTPNLRFSTDLITGAGNDTVNISGTSGVLSAYNRGGYDSVYVGNGTLAGINGSVYVSGAGSTYLYIQDYNDTTAYTATLTAAWLSGLSAATIQWTPSSTAMGGVTYLSIAGSSASSTYNVTDTPNVLYSTDLFTGAGNDAVNVTGTTGTLNLGNVGGFDSVYVGLGTLANINGSVNVSAAGSTSLIVQDVSDTTAHSVTLTATQLTGLSRGAIQWVPSAASMGGVVFMVIEGSAAASTYTVTDTPNLAYYTDLATGTGSDSVYVTGTTGILFVSNGGGADALVIGRQAGATSGGKVAAIKGRVVVNGYATVDITVDDSGDTNGRSATLTNIGLTGLVPAGIYFDTNIVTSLTINGGNGNDTLTVTGTPTGTPVTFNGGAGGDTLVGPNTTNFWSITGNGIGNLNSAVNFSNVENLVGGTAVDTFVFGPVGGLSNISGGGAPAGQGDWLDYTAATTAVSANLATGKVSGVTGTAGGIQNVFGGNFGNTLTGNAQGNILIGGDAADTIFGGSGRSLLIGGKGNDTITGGAADDIVIGGYTTYGSAWHEAELMDLLARWQSADSYATRVSNIRNGYRPLAFGTTVFDDGGIDKLTGGAGMDWFFAGTHGTITDLQAGEAVN